MQQDGFDTKALGHAAGMLAARAAEAIQKIALHIMAARDGNFLDRLRHMFNGDIEKTFCDIFNAAPVIHVAGHRRKAATGCVRVKGCVLIGAENCRKIVRLQTAEAGIDIGDGERAAAPITGGPRIGAGRFRADPKARAVIAQQ